MAKEMVGEKWPNITGSWMGALWTFRGAVSCKANSGSVTPSVIPFKEEMAQVTV